MTETQHPVKSPSWWPYGLSLALLYVTFPLIWMGGLVTTYDAGMAVPDWPSTYGYNLFLYPWSSWFWGPWDLFVEHGHRLLASFAGVLAIALLIAVHLREPRIWVRRYAWGALALVILQGVLGGARVVLDQRVLAMIHGCVGPLFFMYVGAMAIFTEPHWHRAEPYKTQAGAKLNQLMWTTLALSFIQLILGANLRHIRVDASATVFSVIAMFHVVLALVVVFHAVLLWVRSRHADIHKLVRGGCTRVASLAILQLGLGVATWTMKYGWPTWLPQMAFAQRMVVENEGLAQSMTVTAHMAMGSMLLVHCLVACVRGLRIMRAPAPEGTDETDDAAAALLRSTSQVQECIA